VNGPITSLTAAALELVEVAVLVVDASGQPVLMNRAWREAHGLTGADGRDDELGQSGMSWSSLVATRRVLAGDGVTELEEWQLPTRQALAGQLGTQEIVLEIAGERRRWACSGRPISGPEGSVIGAVVSAHDVTSAHARTRLLSRHARQLGAVAAASRAVLREQDARATVCRAVASVCDALAVTLWEPDRHGDLVVTAATAPDLVGMRMPVEGRSHVAEVYTTGTPRTCEDVTNESGINQAVILRAAELLDRPIGAGIWIPAMGRGRCVAVLTIGLAAGATALEEHVPVLEILAGEAAVAIERQDLLAQLQTQAGTDPLTLVGNRRRWDEELPRYLAAAALDGVPASVLILDVDHFKRYNDAHGHPAGDTLLQKMTAGWTARLRPGDLLCRYGGEEFALALPGCDTPAALRVADDLRSLMPDGQTLSAGVATWDRDESPTDLVSRADQALYTAKRLGRDQARAAG
jgi:diguanylate cyclase (GGDEF)-like protein